MGKRDPVTGALLGRRLMSAKCLQLLRVGAVLVAGCFVAQTAFAGGQVEARRDGVKVHAKPSKKSKVFGKLKKGDVLAAEERKGMYWSVERPKGGTGYVSVLKVSYDAGGSQDLAGAIRSVVNEGKPSSGDAEEMRSRSSVMGVRGLKSGGTASASNVRPNLRAVMAMEAIEVPEGRVERLEKAVFQEITARSRKQSR